LKGGSDWKKEALIVLTGRGGRRCIIYISGKRPSAEAKEKLFPASEGKSVFWEKRGGLSSLRENSKHRRAAEKSSSLHERQASSKRNRRGGGDALVLGKRAPPAAWKGASSTKKNQGGGKKERASQDGKKKRFSFELRK